MSKQWIISPEKLAKATDTSKSWVYEKIKSGELPSVTLPGGRLIRVPVAALEAKLGIKLEADEQE
jgi:excisionase family DNA binding protein